MPQREVLQGLYEKSGEMPADLISPPFPESLRYLWEWYLSLRMGVGESMTWTALDAWARRLRVDIRPIEAEALFYIESAWHNAQAAK